MCNHDKPTNESHTRGTTLEHGHAHTHDHQRWSRRTFLRQLGVAGTASFLLGKVPLHALSSSPLAMALNTNEHDGRILVLIRLKGGNDGLNTVIPIFDYGTYQSRRPSIAIPQNETFALNDALALPNTMGGVADLWAGGQMKLVNNVGYPDHNLSHFRSTDIWSAAVDADETTTSGWLGRVLEQEYPDFLNNPPDTPPAIQMGSAGNLTYNDSAGFDMSLNITNAAQLRQIASTGQLYDPEAVPGCHYGEQLSYLRAVANNTFRYAEVVADAYDTGENSVEYGNYSLAEQLALVARLIRGGLGTRLYMVVHDGFDTHANQAGNHPRLLQQLADAVRDFHQDLRNAEQGDRVLSMTLSEFGRRIEQNASAGTDHGAAAPLFLFGDALEGNGSLGGLPDLDGVDAFGNLVHQVDFRSIYATILERWLCIDPGLVDQVMGETFERMPELGFDCAVTSTFDPRPQPTVALKSWFYGGQLFVSYDIPHAAEVEITLYNMLGQPLQRVFNAYQLAGAHQQQFNLADIGWAAGVYVCNLRVGSHQYSKQISLVR